MFRAIVLAWYYLPTFARGCDGLRVALKTNDGTLHIFEATRDDFVELEISQKTEPLPLKDVSTFAMASFNRDELRERYCIRVFAREVLSRVTYWFELEFFAQPATDSDT